MDEITVRSGNVTTVGTQRVGVRWVWEDEYVGKSGKTEHGMAAGLSISPPERKQTVGRGSMVHLGPLRYEVTQIVDGNSASVTLKRLP